MKINIAYDASVTVAPAGFTDAVDAAVAFYEANFDAPVTVNITIGWGTAAGNQIPDGALGATFTSGYDFNYEEVRNALWADAQTSDALTAATNLPAADPTNGGTFFMTSAQAKALGLVPTRMTASDGTIVLDTTSTYTFDPNNRQVAGKVDAIGVLEHEIGHVLGRVSSLGEALPGGNILYGALDLFRYSVPGVLSPAAGTAYFSIDGQHLLLPFNDPANGGTPSDWSISLTGDVYDAFGDEGELLQFSSTDKTMLDVFGYHPHQAAPSTPVPGTLPLNSANLADGAQIAQGQTAYFSDYANYTLLGSATNAGTIVKSSTVGGVAIDVIGYGGFPASAVFTNTATGIVMSEATGNSTSDGIVLDNQESVSNAGLIQSVSQGIAHGVTFVLASSNFTNAAGGTVRVWGKYDATGVVFIQGGNFDNAGLIEVTGDIDLGLVAPGATGVVGMTSFNNSGTIKAISVNEDGPSIGVVVARQAPIGGLLTNSGTIIADYAFYVSEGSVSPAFQPDINIVNSGKIIGAISLANGSNQIHNTGIIAGNIHFGNTASTYDGAGGHLYGDIYLGFAANTVTLGNDGDTVYGGGGVDTVTGGAGNDTFMIARGDNHLNGAGGYNTLSLESAARGYTVDLGAGTAVGAGTTTIANMQRVIGSGFADTLIAGNSAAFLMAGGGADTLRGGAAADTLVAGAGGDVLTGDGGDDTFIYTAGDQQSVITDFRSNGNQDVLKIFAYGSAVSTQQQGADTLITLSGSDKILLKNVLSSSLTGGAVVYEAEDYLPPLTSLPLDLFGSDPIYLNHALKVYAGEQISMKLGSANLEYDGITMDGDTNKPNVVTGIDNFGNMSFSANGGDLNAINMGGNIEDSSAFINEAGASFTAINSNGVAHGIWR